MLTSDLFAVSNLFVIIRCCAAYADRRRSS